MQQALDICCIFRRAVFDKGPLKVDMFYKGLFSFVVCLVVAASGCGSAVETMWSVEVPSPDGLWIASARTDQTSGPGNADLTTGVYLRRTNRADSATTVLLFQNKPVSSKRAITPRIEWLTPSHLQVTFNQLPDFYSQTIKYAGIDISVGVRSSVTK